MPTQSKQEMTDAIHPVLAQLEFWVLFSCMYTLKYAPSARGSLC